MRSGAVHVLLLLLCNVELLANPTHGNLATTYQTLAKIKSLQHDSEGAAKYEKLAATVAKARGNVRAALKHAVASTDMRFEVGDDDETPKKRGFWKWLRLAVTNMFALSCIFLTAVLAGWEFYETFCPAINNAQRQEGDEYDEDFDIITYNPQSPLRKLVNVFG
jgi:hypothetical protein